VAHPGTGGWRRVLRWVAWWAVLFGLWLLFVGEWTWLVAVWGAGLSFLATVSAGVVAAQGLLDARGRWSWARELGPSATAVVVDFVILTRALVAAVVTGRREVGLFVEDGSSGAGDGPLAAGRRAWIAVVATWSPNCYVVDIDPGSGRRILHDLQPHRASELPA
jgi:hypothetical protein